MKILALDTATEACSAALYVAGEVSEQFEIAPREHGELILPMIEQLLASAGLDPGQLDAIAFGRGPGAFTGVRIAAGVTQGIAFAAGLPVIAISDLAAVALVAIERHDVQRVLVCMDARMGEVYWAQYSTARDELHLCGTERLGPPASVQVDDGAFGAGSGWAAYPELSQRLAFGVSEFDAQLLPRASAVARLAVPVLRRGEVLRPEQAVPVYLRDEVAWKKS